MECYFVVNNKSFHVPFKGIFTGIKISFYDLSYVFFCSYFISRKPIDERPDYYFKIDQSGLNGTVSLKNSLDYEAVPKHIVRILAIDRGRTQDPENKC